MSKLKDSMIKSKIEQYEHSRAMVKLKMDSELGLTEENLKEAIKNIGDYAAETSYQQPKRVWALGQTWKYPEEFKALQKALKKEK